LYLDPLNSKNAASWVLASPSAFALSKIACNSLTASVQAHSSALHDIEGHQLGPTNRECAKTFGLPLTILLQTVRAQLPSDRAFALGALGRPRALPVGLVIPIFVI
jgi:hypothetical protein